MIYNRKVAAIVPIKEHSERVKGKNFRDFNRKPLYHHILYMLENTYAIDKIIVDTDSLIVKNEAPQIFSKVMIIDRPNELRGDFVSVNKLIEYDISHSDCDIFIQTHATNPLLKAETIAAALRAYLDSEETHDSLITVTKHQSRFYFKDNKPVNHNPLELIRTQDLDPLFEENSVLYIFTKESFAKNKHRIGHNPFLYETPFIESIDIDNEFEFKLAEMLSMYSVKN